MKSLAKSFLLLCIGVSVLAASNSAYAGTKDWQGTKPAINIHAQDNDIKFNVTMTYDVTKRTSTSYYHDGMSATFPGDKFSMVINDLIIVPQGATFSISELSIKSKEGSVLPNCNMMENPAFLAGATNIDISVTKEGCVVN